MSFIWSAVKHFFSRKAYLEQELERLHKAEKEHPGRHVHCISKCERDLLKLVGEEKLRSRIQSAAPSKPDRQSAEG